MEITTDISGDNDEYEPVGIYFVRKLNMTTILVDKKS